MRVLVIPEDFRKDQYMLEPIIQAMLKRKGKSHAKVIICRDPLLGGVNEAMKWARLQQIIEKYRSRIDVFVLCVDRDGVKGRKFALNSLEERAAEVLPADTQFLAENAWQEIEVWVLAGQTHLPRDWNWAEIREEAHPKERYFLPFAKERTLLDEPGQGRKTLAHEAAKHYDRVRQLSPEVAELESRINA